MGRRASPHFYDCNVREKTGHCRALHPTLLAIRGLASVIGRVVPGMGSRANASTAMCVAMVTNGRVPSGAGGLASRPPQDPAGPHAVHRANDGVARLGTVASANGCRSLAWLLFSCRGCYELGCFLSRLIWFWR
jgi:hypothetical protein